MTSTTRQDTCWVPISYVRHDGMERTVVWNFVPAAALRLADRRLSTAHHLPGSVLTANILLFPKSSTKSNRRLFEIVQVTDVKSSLFCIL